MDASYEFMPNGNLKIEHAQILFRNFAGNEKKFNPAGNRNFCVFIDDAEFAQAMAEDGWNVRILAPRDPEESGRHYMQVTVRYDRRPPNIYLHTQRKNTLLDQESVGTLDYAEIVDVDLVIHPSIWDDNGRDRIKAYVNTMHVTIEEDAFADKYATDGEPW